MTCMRGVLPAKIIGSLRGWNSPLVSQFTALERGSDFTPWFAIWVLGSLKGTGFSPYISGSNLSVVCNLGTG